jgi:transcriptional antiterminator NusG
MTTESTETGKEKTAKPAKKSWYVVHTYSGYENKAKQALEDKIKANGLEEYFGQILVPSEKVTETKSGVKRTSTKKFFPSYLFVEMELNEKSWHCVKNTPKITGFVGGGTRPSPVPEAEVLRITSQIADGTLKPTVRVSFDRGDTVRVTGTSVSGMTGMTGIIEEVNNEKGRATVMISILGRSVPVEFKFNEIEKT